MGPDIKIIWLPHALDMCAKRGILKEWALKALFEPVRVEPDPNHKDRIRVWRRIPEFGGRMLRLVYEEEQEAVVIITVVWDRNAGRRV